MSTSSRAIVGAIGGMGPEATVEFLRRVVSRTPAQDDSDHLHLLVESSPQIPSRIAHLIERTGDDPTPELARIARNLETAGATLLAMPCNTAHGYAGAIRSAVSIPLLDMVQLASEKVRAVSPGARVGLLASTAVHNTRLYASALARLDMIVVEPSRQDDVMTLIRDVKRGQTGKSSQEQLRRIAVELAASCDSLLIACTELSVLAQELTLASPAVDSLDVLTDAVIAAALPRN
jgi:aspartate racemase